MVDGLRQRHEGCTCGLPAQEYGDSNSYQRGGKERGNGHDGDGGALAEGVSGTDPTWQRQQVVADEVDFAMPLDGEGEDVEQSPSLGVSGPLELATEDTNDLEKPDSRVDVEARSITNPCDDPTALLEDIAMQVKEEGASSISPKEGIGEEVMTRHIDEFSPKEMVEHSLFAISPIAVIRGVGCNPPSLFGIVDCPLHAYVTVTMMAVEVDGGL